MPLGRASLLAFLSGLTVGVVPYYILHQDVWKSMEEMLQLVSSRQVVPLEHQDTSSTTTFQEESLERLLKQKAVSWWNGTLGVIQRRLINLPDAAEQLQEDGKHSIERVGSKLYKNE